MTVISIASFLGRNIQCEMLRNFVLTLNCFGKSLYTYQGGRDKRIVFHNNILTTSGQSVKFKMPFIIAVHN
ncbi:hypothetical protein O999_01995 [Pseudomonas putida LF54]|nr:hypothetical protein O999_01995 [Pseudomonas putida LF54]